MVYGNVWENIVKYIFIRKQKVVLFLKLRKNQRKTVANALIHYFIDKQTWGWCFLSNIAKKAPTPSLLIYKIMHYVNLVEQKG
jgi:hypothetical protein